MTRSPDRQRRLDIAENSAGPFGPVEHRASLPEEVAARIAAEIEAGRLAPGSQLPPEHVLIADFGVNKLKHKKWVIVHSTDAFGAGGAKALSEALKGYGVEPVLVQGYTNNTQDFTPVVLAIKKSGADVIGSYMTMSQDVGIFAKQLRQLGVGTTWIGSASIVTDTAMKLAGNSLEGTFGVADFNPDANDQAKAFSKAYRAACTPDIFVFDSTAGGRRLAYRGQLDDSRPKNGLPVTGKDLRAALDAVLAGKPVSPEQQPSIGCNIKWKPGNEPDYFK